MSSKTTVGKKKARKRITKKKVAREKTEMEKQLEKVISVLADFSVAVGDRSPTTTSETIKAAALISRLHRTLDITKGWPKEFEVTMTAKILTSGDKIHAEKRIMSFLDNASVEVQGTNHGVEFSEDIYVSSVEPV